MDEHLRPVLGWRWAGAITSVWMRVVAMVSSGLSRDCEENSSSTVFTLWEADEAMGAGVAVSVGFELATHY